MELDRIERERKEMEEELCRTREEQARVEAASAEEEVEVHTFSAPDREALWESRAIWAIQDSNFC